MLHECASVRRRACAGMLHRTCRSTRDASNGSPEVCYLIGWHCACSSFVSISVAFERTGAVYIPTLVRSRRHRRGA